MPSFWLSQHDDEFRRHRTTEKLPEEADIVIIGSGYTGASVAHFLYEFSDRPPKTVMLEARGICSGATGRNGGHLKPDLYLAHINYEAKYGAEEAARIINFEFDHIKAIKDLVEEEKIDCDFVLTRSCDVHLNTAAAEKAVANYKSMLGNPYVKCKHDLQLITGEQAKIVSEVEATDVAVTFPAGQLWPYKLIRHILKQCLKKGLNLQAYTPVLKTHQRPDGKWIVSTERGSIVCDKLFIATNGYTPSVESSFKDVIVPIKGVCAHITSADSKDRLPHLTQTYGIRFGGALFDYLINRPDGSVIVGGAKEHIFPFKKKFYNSVDDSTLIEGTYDYFDGYMQRHYYTWKNAKSEIELIWSGILGYTTDGLPMIGEIENGKYIIAGFNGHGMPRVFLSARELVKSVLKHIPLTETDLPRSFIWSSDRMSKSSDVYSRLWNKNKL